MKRWPLRILLCLILGAISTVAVAWGLAWADAPWPTVSDGPALSTEEERWLDSHGLLAHDPRVKQMSYGGYGFGRRVRNFSEDSLMGYPSDFAWWSESGWPCLALRQESLIVRHATINRPAIDESLRPIWPGFVINTLFYAAIRFGMFFGFATAKRAIRRKRGRCPRCGYDLRGDLAAGCSECEWNRSQTT